MEKHERACKPHVLVLPYPAQGHINPMLQFSKRLVSKGVKATLITTISISKFMPADPNSLIDVETISDGFDDGRSHDEDFLRSFKAVGSQTLTELIKKLKDSGVSINALIYDGFLPWALDAAKQFGVPGALFFTQSCAVNSIYFYVKSGKLPVPLSEPTVSVPGLPLLKASETPSFVSSYGSYPSWTDIVLNQFSNIDEADWVLLNTFYELEKQVDWMAKLWRLGTVGPTLPSMYLDKRLEDDKDYGINLLNPNKTACMSWLHNKPTGSVVYVSFGSMAELGEEQMGEIAWGLKRSNCYFLWVVRALEQAKLPKNFIEETSDKGLVVPWCPQLEVLVHESIGCFVTHCGFNSVLEALCLGVAVVAVPQWTDQITNAKYVEDIWGTGIRTEADGNGIVKREEVEKCIKEVHEGETGKEMKKNAKKWKNLAKEAIDAGGSSEKNIDEFVAYLVSS
ncbi:UDP-glycosyltransferase 74G1-like isoform X2 [Tripterygium wilfordii]|uniref:UDP-glycosyltransferase 74G1-like isoform X2 n=1 Tax=Tripterygium wilfordii TaxID=458696 RepID=UPI0018F83C79|nr:UDP-glycosyltransferase 74G1-like isoform X2 [Tripterygium wilfordii]